MSLVTQIIVNADDELRYPTIGELQSIQDYLTTGSNRIRIATIIRDKEKEIIQKASKQIFQLHPEYIAPGGNAAGSRKRSLCLRDYGWYLRLITYGVLAGDKDSIETIGIIGVREMYNSLGVPIIGMLDAIQCLKEASLEMLGQDDIRIISPYFDYIIRGMS
uniref:Allophycocyanin alpha-B chain n=2 Tax=Pyropia yezoensis TaxID=2788 RepID=APCD_PYRYE|nr:allophycocyanin gamma subunit [Neopyropia yezoensis]Q1XDU2.1 RecName: Full=Allophycocyanin alpha-B chain; AltName: Full=Allophycocyanin gamma chain [Neopyropia yezoensis]AGH27519.1 allophycocyanin gamma subunit [Neopyropia yezoensis]QFZ66855.1 allophycocyanin gamma subunit [Neopyropia yezoensis]ULU28859.1 allophycocyanin gamma subunit [Neopyropia yezoensis]WKD83350.1 allophycocyanin gamma subunit [Neopyropia yezoensis]BAE92319.1 allophycocyanin gamma chain [Neopyropia yezoensis]